MDRVSLTLATVFMASIGALIGAKAPVGGPSRSTNAAQTSSRFMFCRTGGGYDCVVDGDTAWVGGVKVRIADIDAPETHPPHCPEEARLGERATRRLAELMN